MRNSTRQRSRLSSAEPESHGDLLVLDPQTEGALLVGRLRRSIGNGRQGEAVTYGAQSARLEMLDYIFYSALTVAALYETASADEQQAWRRTPGSAPENSCASGPKINPPTFADKHALVLAEIARIEKRDADALRLYEQAIHLARENGFVQNEGLAHELAAQYCLSRGIESAGYCSSTQRAQLLRPLGRARKSKATRRTISAAARGATVRIWGHDWPASCDSSTLRP